MTALLTVTGLRTHFDLRRGVVRAVDGVDLTIHSGETVALVGESGSGKSLTAYSVIGLMPDPQASIVAGEIRFRGEDLVGMSPRRRRAVRGTGIGLVSQDPDGSLNPVFPVGAQIAAGLRRAGMRGRRQLRAAAHTLMAEVGIADPPSRSRSYPHEFSGGQRQRLALAVALAARPSLLIADEITSALDTTTQRGIIELLAGLRRSRDLSLLFITHDLRLALEIADQVAVMYAGRVVEFASAEAVARQPGHPYTRAIFEAVPDLHQSRGRLSAIPGQPPSPLAPPPGCPFAPRCPERMPACDEVRPPTVPFPNGGEGRCLLHGA